MKPLLKLLKYFLLQGVRVYDPGEGVSDHRQSESRCLPCVYHYLLNTENWGYDRKQMICPVFPWMPCSRPYLFVVLFKLCHVWSFDAPQTAAHQAPLSFASSRSLLKLMPLSRWCHPTSSHPLSTPSPPVFNLSQYQGLSQWVSSLHQVAKGLELQLQHQSFQWTVKKVKVKVAQACPTLCSPMDYTAHGTLQARILGWVPFPFARGSSQPRDWTQVSGIAGRFFTSWATREAQEYWSGWPIPSPGDLPDPGIEPGPPALQADSLPTEISRKPPNEYSGSISFRIDWFGLLAVQGTLRSFLQHHNSKASILWSLTFFIAQLSCPYTASGKAIALTIQTFVSKVSISISLGSCLYL